MIFLRLMRRFSSVGACARDSMDWTFRRMSPSTKKFGESPELNGWVAGKTTASRNRVTDRFVHQESDFGCTGHDQGGHTCKSPETSETMPSASICSSGLRS